MNKPHPSSQRYDPRQFSGGELVEHVHSKLLHVTHAYGELVRRYRHTLFNACIRYLGSGHGADDVYQEVILKVLYRLENFEGRSKFKTWLHSITYNECITQYRRERRKRRLIDVPSLDSLEEVSEEKSPKVEERGGLGRWLVHVNPIGREILALHFAAGLEFQEIADIMHTGPNTTKMRYKRVLNRPREEFSDATETQLDKYCPPMREVLINLPPKLCG